jgi:hypothetical protein
MAVEPALTSQPAGVMVEGLKAEDVTSAKEVALDADELSSSLELIRAWPNDIGVGSTSYGRTKS